MPTKKPAITVYLDPALKNRLDGYALSHGERSLSSAVSSILQDYFGESSQAGNLRDEFAQLRKRVDELEEQQKYRTGADKVLYLPNKSTAPDTVLDAPITAEKGQKYTRMDAIKLSGYPKSAKNFNRDTGLDASEWLLSRGWKLSGRQWYID